MKQFLLVFLCFALVFGAFSACGAPQTAAPSGAESSDEGDLNSQQQQAETEDRTSVEPEAEEETSPPAEPEEGEGELPAEPEEGEGELPAEPEGEEKEIFVRTVSLDFTVQIREFGRFMWEGDFDFSQYKDGVRIVLEPTELSFSSLGGDENREEYNDFKAIGGNLQKPLSEEDLDSMYLLSCFEADASFLAEDSIWGQASLFDDPVEHRWRGPSAGSWSAVDLGKTDQGLRLYRLYEDGRFGENPGVRFGETCGFVVYAEDNSWACMLLFEPYFTETAFSEDAVSVYESLVRKMTFTKVPF